MAAAEGIEFRRPLKSSQPIEEVHRMLRVKVAPRVEDREFSRDQEAVAAMIEHGDLDGFAPSPLQALLS
jgi:histidine ammonia-lyase